jgi:alpha-acetolactate decarboxylase
LKPAAAVLALFMLPGTIYHGSPARTVCDLEEGFQQNIRFVSLSLKVKLSEKSCATRENFSKLSKIMEVLNAIEKIKINGTCVNEKKHENEICKELFFADCLITQLLIAIRKWLS